MLNIKNLGLLLLVFSLFSFHKVENKVANKTIKCLIQIKNYSGEGAYIAISLVDAQETYKETLYVVGDDEKWYETVEEWWKHLGKSDSNLDALSGATINPGARSIIAFEIPEDKIDAGYSLRFESAVEDQDYHVKDVEFPLTTASLKQKLEGTGYVRYVRLMSN